MAQMHSHRGRDQGMVWLTLDQEPASDLSVVDRGEGGTAR